MGNLGRSMCPIPELRLSLLPVLLVLTMVREYPHPGHSQASLLVDTDPVTLGPPRARKQGPQGSKVLRD